MVAPVTSMLLWARPLRPSAAWSRCFFPHQIERSDARNLVAAVLLVVGVALTAAFTKLADAGERRA